MNIIEWMIENKIAQNGFAASAIANGLKLQNYDTEMQKQKCLLYRKWRKKTDRKNDIPAWQAFQLAIAGIDPDDVQIRQIEMMLEVT